VNLHFDITQGTEEWKAIRRGSVTMSEIGPFVLNSGKVAEAARQKLIDKKLAEWAGESEEVFVNDAMKRGTALEPIARRQYELMIGHPIQEIGFVSADTHLIGASPDGILMSEDGKTVIGGAEFKCPGGASQVRYLREKVLPDEYRFQVHGTLAVTGAPFWDFMSFCPKVTQWTKTRDMWVCDEWEAGKLPSFYIRVYRDAFTEELHKGLLALSDEITRQREWLEALNS
jgi:YqaJ-like viral recombinase domain